MITDALHRAIGTSSQVWEIVREEKIIFGAQTPAVVSSTNINTRAQSVTIKTHKHMHKHIHKHYVVNRSFTGISTCSGGSYRFCCFAVCV
jgi:hypothetical protein